MVSLEKAHNYSNKLQVANMHYIPIFQDSNPFSSCFNQQWNWRDVKNTKQKNTRWLKIHFLVIKKREEYNKFMKILCTSEVKMIVFL